MRCKATTKSGRPCYNSSSRYGFCPVHEDQATDEDRREHYERLAQRQLTQALQDRAGRMDRIIVAALAWADLGTAPGGPALVLDVRWSEVPWYQAARKLQDELREDRKRVTDLAAPVPPAPASGPPEGGAR